MIKTVGQEQHIILNFEFTEFPVNSLRRHAFCFQLNLLHFLIKPVRSRCLVWCQQSASLDDIQPTFQVLFKTVNLVSEFIECCILHLCYVLLPGHAVAENDAHVYDAVYVRRAKPVQIEKSISSIASETPCRQIRFPETAQCTVSTVEGNIRAERMGVIDVNERIVELRLWRDGPARTDVDAFADLLYSIDTGNCSFENADNS